MNELKELKNENENEKKSMKKDTSSATNKLLELNAKCENLIHSVMSNNCSNFWNVDMSMFESPNKELLKGFVSMILRENLEKIRQISGKLLNKGNAASASKGVD